MLFFCYCYYEAITLRIAKSIDLAIEGDSDSWVLLKAFLVARSTQRDNAESELWLRCCRLILNF